MRASCSIYRVNPPRRTVADHWTKNAPRPPVRPAGRGSMLFTPRYHRPSAGGRSLLHGALVAATMTSASMYASSDVQSVGYVGPRVPRSRRPPTAATATDRGLAVVCRDVVRFIRWPACPACPACPAWPARRHIPVSAAGCPTPPAHRRSSLAFAYATDDAAIATSAALTPDINLRVTM